MLVNFPISSTMGLSAFLSSAASFTSAAIRLGCILLLQSPTFQMRHERWRLYHVFTRLQKRQKPAHFHLSTRFPLTTKLKINLTNAISPLMSLTDFFAQNKTV